MFLHYDAPPYMGFLSESISLTKLASSTYIECFGFYVFETYLTGFNLLNKLNFMLIHVYHFVNFFQCFKFLLNSNKSFPACSKTWCASRQAQHTSCPTCWSYLLQLNSTHTTWWGSFINDLRVASSLCGIKCIVPGTVVGPSFSERIYWTQVEGMQYFPQQKWFSR